MNKKQLIVAWVIGVLSSILLFLGLKHRSPYLRLLDEGSAGRWNPSVWSYLSVILIIGSLLIYTLNNKIISVLDNNKKINIKKIIAREGLVFLAFIALGFLIMGIFASFNLDHGEIGFYFYPFYLIICFIIWAIRSLKGKEN
jgi:uncharacterized membrane protein YidH (DUF202 family)